MKNNLEKHNHNIVKKCEKIIKDKTNIKIGIK